jgi:hypothetical protein
MEGGSQGDFGSGVRAPARAALIRALTDGEDGAGEDLIAVGAATSYTQMLWMGLKKKAAYLPGC